MKLKGRTLLALITGVIVLAACAFAIAETKAPDKPYVIDNSDVFKARKSTPVTFDHAKHKELACTTCHHEFKDGQNVWKEGQEVKKCSACHKLEADGKIVKLYAAFHADSEHSCVGCHEKMKKEQKKSGPTTCAQCHPKKGAGAEAK
jgi:hypothetical protein